MKKHAHAKQPLTARIAVLLMTLVLLTSTLPLSIFAREASGSGQKHFVSVGPSQYGTTYYVDAEKGSDARSGKSPDAAWQSLNKVTSTVFKPGDHVLLRAGSVWNGQMLYPKGSGSSGNSIVVDLYDLDSNQNAVYEADTRPVINGNGTQGIGTKKTIISGAVMIYNQEHWEFRNLEVTNSEDLSNPDLYKKHGKTQRAGILAYTDNQEKIYDHVVIKDCYVHDVQTEYYQRANDRSVGGLKACGGIIILGHHLTPDGEIRGDSICRSQAAFNDVLIEGNVVRRVGLEGIRTKCNSDTAKSGNTFLKQFTNIIIRNNYLEEIAGDAIVLTEVKSGGLVEKNIAKQPCNADYGTHNYAGIWSMFSDDAIFQYNEVYGTIYGYNDGEAYDIDMSCDGNLYQYNYSHHNGGGFLLFMGNQSNSVVRYNISANDGGGNHGTGVDRDTNSGYTYKEQSIFHYWNKEDNASMPTIYNNTFYVGDGISTSLFGEGNSANNSGVIARFYNNIICKEGSGSFKFLTNYPNNGSDAVERTLGENPQNFFKNNVIWPKEIATKKSGATPEVLEPSGNIFADPKLVFQNTSGAAAKLAAQNKTTLDDGDIYHFTSAEVLRQRASLFKLQDTSPAVAKGMPVTGAPDADLFDNPIADVVPDIGAHQLSSIPLRTDIKEIPEVKVETIAGIYPKLPREITVVFTDVVGKEQTERQELCAVEWDLIPLQKYTQAGTFTIFGTIAGIEEKAKATVTVRGEIGSGDFVKSTPAVSDAFIQRYNANTAYGAVAGKITFSGGDMDKYPMKYPLGASFSDNYVLKIKNAGSAGYNRRFLVQFNLDDYKGNLESIKNASVRLHISRYDLWNQAGGSNDDQKMRNTRRNLDVYAVDSSWNENAVTWNNAPLNAEITANNHNGGGDHDNQPPTYDKTKPVSHKMYINNDVVANGHTIEVDVSDYIRTLKNGEKSVSFLVDIPCGNDYDKDNSGFDAFSKEGAAAAYQAYTEKKLPAGIEVKSATSLAPQLVISEVYETGIEKIEVTTKLGDTPNLPDEAKLLYSDNTTKHVGVIWNSIEPEKYLKEGEFTVTGYSGATNMPITATVHVVADHIVSFKKFEDIHVVVGLPKNELGLPDKAIAILDDSRHSEIEIPIASWEDSAPPYSPGNAPDRYTFAAALGTLPNGVTNPNDAKPAQIVITYLKPDADQKIVGVKELAPITVLKGTTQENLPLPKVATAIFEDQTEMALPVTNWKPEGSYSPNAVGQMVFKGEFRFASNNPQNIRPSVVVTVAESAYGHLLEQTLQSARLSIENKAVDRLIPSKKASFMKAFNEAGVVFSNPLATQDEVNRAYRNLLEEIWNLNYVKADKSQLQELVNTAKNINLDDYNAQTAAAFRKALTEAEKLLADEELTAADQQAIADGMENLRAAKANLSTSTAGNSSSGKTSHHSGSGSSSSRLLKPHSTSSEQPKELQVEEPAAETPSSGGNTAPVQGSNSTPQKAEEQPDEQGSLGEESSSSSEDQKESVSSSASSSETSSDESEPAVAAEKDEMPQEGTPPWGIILPIALLVAAIPVVIAVVRKLKQSKLN